MGNVLLVAQPHLDENQSKAPIKTMPRITTTPFTVSLFGSAGSVDLYTTRLPRRSVGL
jgi:hypothetical protein